MAPERTSARDATSRSTWNSFCARSSDPRIAIAIRRLNVGLAVLYDGRTGRLLVWLDLRVLGRDDLCPSPLQRHTSALVRGPVPMQVRASRAALGLPELGGTLMPLGRLLVTSGRILMAANRTGHGTEFYRTRVAPRVAAVADRNLGGLSPQALGIADAERIAGRRMAVRAPTMLAATKSPKGSL